MQILSDNFETMLIELVGRQVDKSIKEIEKKYAIRNRYLNKNNASMRVFLHQLWIVGLNKV